MLKLRRVLSLRIWKKVKELGLETKTRKIPRKMSDLIEDVCFEKEDSKESNRIEKEFNSMKSESTEGCQFQDLDVRFTVSSLKLLQSSSDSRPARNSPVVDPKARRKG